MGTVQELEALELEVDVDGRILGRRPGSDELRKTCGGASHVLGDSAGPDFLRAWGQWIKMAPSIIGKKNQYKYFI